MTTLDAPPSASTHDVTNQPPPLVGHDVADDPVLLAGVEREGAGWHVSDLHRLGRLAGSEEAQRWGDQANRHEPELHTHDRYGHRVDEVEFHPAWHSLLDVAVSEGLAGACARTRKRSHIGALVNHLCPRSAQVPSACGVATVVLARTSEPPCFSVIPMPASSPALPVGTRRPGSYVRLVSSGS